MKYLLTTIIGLAFAQGCFAQNIVATIKPLHSLVQNILGDTTNAELLIDNTSPHDYQLKPSDLRLINNADVIFYIDPILESFIGKIVKLNASSDQKFIQLTSQNGITLLHPRSESHDHDHDQKITDAHIWLDPENAKIMIKIITQILSNTHPENKKIYESNLLTTIEKLEQLDLTLKAKLKPLQQIAFIAQHDAYQYFDNRYNLNFIEAIALNASIPASMKLPQNIRTSIEENKVKCIFSEPQYSDRLIKQIAIATKINIGVLDPIGLDLAPGQTLYFDLLTNLANNFEKCLTQTP